MVPIRRPDLLAKAVLDVLSDYDELRSMALRGRELISVAFDPKRCADEIMRIYRHILSHEPRPMNSALSDSWNCGKLLRRWRRRHERDVHKHDVVGHDFVKMCSFKRVLDLVVSSLMILLLSPLLAAIAILVRLRLGSPVLFRQERAGWFGSRFECLPFRTMTDARDANGQLLPDANRLIGLGRYLRSTSLDELPELHQRDSWRNRPRRAASAVGEISRTLLSRADAAPQARPESGMGADQWQKCSELGSEI